MSLVIKSILVFYLAPAVLCLLVCVCWFLCYDAVVITKLQRLSLGSFRIDAKFARWQHPATGGGRALLCPVLLVFKGAFIATQLDSTSSWVELRRRSVYSDADATRLNSTQLDVELSTRSQREQLSQISSERRGPVDSVCRSWRHIWRVLTSLPADGILEWRIWR